LNRVLVVVPPWVTAFTVTRSNGSNRDDVDTTPGPDPEFEPCVSATTRSNAS
jgi:hypothetical protein